MKKVDYFNCKIIISYDGSRFFGSQIQKDKITVQGELEKALKKLNITSKTIFAGRTDRGVHASNQVVNLLIPFFWSDLEKLKNKLNLILNHIKIKQIKKVDFNFNARFSAKKRVYRYIISKKELNPFNESYFYHEKQLNLKKLNEAMKLFVGKNDFFYFSKRGSEEKSSICKIYKAFVYEYKDYIIFYFEGNRFLRSQIRIMVNFLVQISKQNLTINDLKAQLDRKKLIFNKPIKPNGLYLAKIKYF